MRSRNKIRKSISTKLNKGIVTRFFNETSLNQYGCRVALSSLNNYSNTGKNSVGLAFNSITGLYDMNISLSKQSVDKFFGVACPATLNNDSTFVGAAQADLYTGGPKVGNVVLSLISGGHTTMRNFGAKALALDVLDPNWESIRPDIIFLIGLYLGDVKISRNLLSYYNTVAINTTDTLNLSGFNVSELHLYYGRLLFTQHDSLVPVTDKLHILSTTNSLILKRNFTLSATDHSSIKNRDTLKESIREELNG